MSIVVLKNITKVHCMIMLISIILSGCTSSNKSTNVLETVQEQEQTLITNSVNHHNSTNGLDDFDAVILKDTVASTNPDHIALPIKWRNPDTETNGTITSIKHFTGKHGQECKAFRTTVNTYQGSAFYDGETCKVSQQEWALTWFKAAVSE